MRALLVVNPKATTTSEHSRDILVRALRSGVDLTVAYTRRRGHGATLARDAARDGVGLVVTLGGDGTVNEVINGLLTADEGPAARRAAGRPALAVVPGGSTNVFARALGLPKDWVEGTYVILEALRDGRSRTINLGRADERYFSFCAGFGLDAEVIRRVERARLRGKSSSPWLYARSFAAQFLLDADRKHPAITLEVPGETAEGELGAVIVQNTAPWTYLAGRPVQACPDASFSTGLDVMALRELKATSTMRTAAQLMRGRAGTHGKRVHGLHDLPGFTLRAERPTAFQLDGDYLGDRDKVEFASVPEALRVLC